MRILIAGGSGFIGKNLAAFWKNKGHEVVTLTRKKTEENNLTWNPEKDEVDFSSLENFDMWINLAGENVLTLWTKEKMKRIENSRIKSTLLLRKALTEVKQPPQVFIQASAIGIYGSREDDLLTEESHPGEGFLADVCKEWEKAFFSGKKTQCRLICVRFGLVLDPSGGPLSDMLPFFRLGLGAKIGSGKQWMSWIALEDVIQLFDFLIFKCKEDGVFNAVAPHPVTNEQFSLILGEKLHRKVFFKIPTWLCLALGKAGKEMLLASARVVPERTLHAGFHFHHPDLKKALSSMFSSKTVTYI